MRLSVQYRTSYRYSEPARRVIQLLRLTPHSFRGQNVLDWRIDLGVDARLRESRDGYGNIIHMLYIDKPLTELTVTVSGKVLTEDRAGVVDGLPGDLPPEVFLRPTRLTEGGKPLQDFAAALEAEGGTRLERLHRLTSTIKSRMSFDTGKTVPDTTALEAFDAGHGVCQDFAHIFIAVARLSRIPARYVSGHLFRRDGKVIQEAAHAWAEAWVENLGWVAFDPTNGISADDAYIRIAAGLDYRDAAPFAGARRGGGNEELSVDVQVRLARTQSQSQSQS
ncbi:MAG TPA: transglutaminase family protein [Allosphingosinicella sp.]|uniref:transglutaminase family protein n=1 Tax=Allosphingosinicella sp. TaxID=2823234 RepID=UPI002EDA7824